MPSVSREPGATLRSRMTTRARTLLEDRKFKSSIQAARAEWNDRFPDFPLSKPGFPDADYEHQIIRDWRPPKLVQAKHCLNYQMLTERGFLPSELRQYGIVPCDCACSWSWPTVNVAEDEWESVVHRLCVEWWPPEHFPIVDPFFHPARYFVAACLIWRIEAVSADLVEAPNLRPRHIAVEELAYWNEMANGLFERLLDHVNHGQPVDHESLARIRDAAHATAFERLIQFNDRSPSARQLDSLFYQDYESFLDQAWSYEPDLALRIVLKPQYVPVFPGMRTTDWRALEAIVQSSLADSYGDDTVAQLARHMSERGYSRSAIAKSLGISRKTVAVYVDGAPTPPLNACA